MPLQITCASALPGKTGKHENFIFHSNVVLVHCLNSASCLIYSIYDSRLILTLRYESLNAFISGMLGGGMVQDKRSRECCRSWTVLHAQCTSALSSGFPIS